MRRSTFPKNGIVLHQVNSYRYGRFRTPINKMIKELDSVKFIPIQLENYFKANKGDLLNPADQPKIFNKLTKYISRVDGVILMFNLLLRTWSQASQQDVDSLREVNKFLIRGVSSVIRFFNADASFINGHPLLRDQVRNLVGVTQRYLRGIESIFSNKGVSF